MTIKLRYPMRDGISRAENFRYYGDWRFSLTVADNLRDKKLDHADYYYARVSDMTGNKHCTIYWPPFNG